jgi:hypothetical protein
MEFTIIRAIDAAGAAFEAASDGTFTVEPFLAFCLRT